MTRQHSNSDLAGNLGASLTPRIDRAATPPRGAQNSGLFDVGAMYAVALDQVMIRAREQGRLVPLPRAAQPTWPRAARWAPPSIPVEVEVPIDFSRTFGATHVGMGWLGMAVAWLGTVTIAALVSVALPAHTEVEARAHAGTIIYVGPAPRAAAPAATLAASPVTAPSTPTPFVVPTATPFVLPTATPFVSAPAAAVPVVTAPAAATTGGQSVLAKKRAVVRAVSAPRMRVHAGTAPAVAVAAPAPTIASTPAAPVSVPAAKPAAASAAAAGTMSLEDLIRHEVQAESKRVP